MVFKAELLDIFSVIMHIILWFNVINDSFHTGGIFLLLAFIQFKTRRVNGLSGY